MPNIAYAFLAFAGDAQPLEKLSPPTRAVVMMALLGMVILGLFLVVVILLGGNWVRRLGRHRRGASVPPDVAPLHRQTANRAKPPSGEKPRSRGSGNASGEDGSPATQETIADRHSETWPTD